MYSYKTNAIRLETADGPRVNLNWTCGASLCPVLGTKHCASGALVVFPLRITRRWHPRSQARTLPPLSVAIQRHVAAAGQSNKLCRHGMHAFHSQPSPLN
jgi:hypothetical protein